MSKVKPQSSVRLRKVNSLVQEELGKIINEEVELPASIMVTIASVETSVDLNHATVNIIVTPKIKTPSTLRQLKRNIYHLQKSLNKRLVLRYVPKIRFAVDIVQDELDRVEELLRQAKEDSSKTCSPNPTSKETA
ncbi:MAG: ribosome-binding factor A [Parcubacteria group bacterium]|nr:ribosome-binding factor A [Parcubacteria group bacterium]